MRRTLCLLLALLVLPLSALAAEGDALLNAEELGELRESYEAFLDELEDMIVEKGCWNEASGRSGAVSLATSFQNGGYGMIAAMYTPDLLEYAREEDTMIRLSLETPAGTLWVDTMRSYTPLDSAQPGLLLELSLTDAEGLPVACRFRYTASSGGFIAWDALRARNSDVGITLINDGRPCYWSDQPLTTDEYADSPVIALEVLGEDDDAQVLAAAHLTLTPSGTGWRVTDDALS